MTRAAVCGGDLVAAAQVLGLEPASERPEVALLDLADPAGVAMAAELDPAIPRIVVAVPEQDVLLRALGSGPLVVAPARTAAAIGPLVARVRPAAPRAATRLIAITGMSGGCGRTLLAVNLALRLATRRVLVVDLTGSGRAAERLGVAAPSWAELEGLVSELTPEHLSVVAAEREAVGVIGGAGSMPSLAIASAAIRAALGAAELVILDAPLLPDERARSAVEVADRVLLVVPAVDPPRELPMSDALVIASRGDLDRVGETEVFRSLPDDPRGARAALREHGRADGAVGRAYDELAEVIAVDASP